MCTHVKPRVIAGGFFLFGLVSASANQASRIPVFFEPNQGQISQSSADFIARQGGRISLLRGSKTVLPPEARNPGELHFSGATAAPKPSQFDPLEGTSNYLHGHDPKHWKTGIRQYGGVRYAQRYPGIDLARTQGQRRHFRHRDL
jgi:hypothetical protein